MNAVKNFNGLNGSVVTRQELLKLIELAIDQEQTEVAQRLEAVLSKFDNDSFQIDLQRQAIECVPASLLPLLDEAPELPDETQGLGKAVSPDDIYQYITDTMINTIKIAGELPWQTMWEKSSLAAGKQAMNFESKKAYRGINFFLLNFDMKIDKETGKAYMGWKNWENPYFLTFKQIEKYKGKLQQGSKGHRVVYFTKLWRFEMTGEDGTHLEFGSYNQKKFIAWLKKNERAIAKITSLPISAFANQYIPILKYYNVFNGGDIAGIDFGDMPVNENANKNEKDKIEVAEMIVDNYPNPPKVRMVGDQPAYYPKSDEILMTPINQFKSPQFFYSVFFHELTHSTGHSKRLKRGNDTRTRDGSKADKKAYDFEELVAEMGSVFLCAESGILFQTRDQSAVYLKHYLDKLVTRMEDDNRFFFRAASASQAAADHILDRDKDGNPAYLKSLKVSKVKTIDPEKEETVTQTFDIVKKKDKTAPKKPIGDTDKEFIVTIPIDSILLDFNKEKASPAQIAALVKNYNPKTFTPLKVWQDKKDSKVYLLEGKNHLEALKKLNEENAPVVFSKDAPKKLSKEELEAANPKGFDKKPKSIAVSTFISDILSLDKYKGKINDRQAAILYSHFKNNPVSEVEVEITSEYEKGILKKDSDLHTFYIETDYLELTDLGVDFVKSLIDRRESLLNQKNNLALFPGLTGATPLEVVKEINNLKVRRNRTKKGTKKHTDLQNKIDALDAKLIRDKRGNTIGLKKKAPEKKPIPKKKGLKSPALVTPKTEPQPETQIIVKPEPATTAQQIDRGDQVAPAVTVNNTTKDFGFVNADEVPETPEGVFRLPGEIGKFIQDIQPYQELIVIKGPPHSSKSQLTMQLANAFGEANMKVAYIDGEQGGIKSKDTIDSRNRNTTPAGRKNIFITGELDNPYEDLKEISKQFSVIVADSVTELGINADQLNAFRKKHPEIIWVFISQVKEGGQMYGGNKMAHNPTKIISCEPNHDFESRVATLEKNRGNSLEPKYNIFFKKLETENPENEDQNQEPVEIENIPGFCITEV